MIMGIHSHSIHEWHIYLHLPWNSTHSCRLNIYHTMDGVGYIFSRFFSPHRLLSFWWVMAWPGLLWQEMDERMLVRHRILWAMDMHLAHLVNLWIYPDSMKKMKNRGFSKRDGFFKLRILRMSDGERTWKDAQANEIHVKLPRTSNQANHQKQKVEKIMVL